ncbi:MAG: hypothetical protein ACYSTY_15060, partial [Planctomycetota bacterium]
MSEANVSQSVDGGSPVGDVDGAAGVLEPLIRASEEASAKFGDILQRGERVRTEVAETAAQLEDRMNLGIRLLKALEQERTRTEAAAARDSQQDLPAEWRQKINDLGARVTATEQHISAAGSDPDRALEQPWAELEAGLAAVERRIDGLENRLEGAPSRLATGASPQTHDTTAELAEIEARLGQAIERHAEEAAGATTRALARRIAGVEKQVEGALSRFDADASPQTHDTTAELAEIEARLGEATQVLARRIDGVEKRIEGTLSRLAANASQRTPGGTAELAEIEARLGAAIERFEEEVQAKTERILGRAESAAETVQRAR